MPTVLVPTEILLEVLNMLESLPMRTVRVVVSALEAAATEYDLAHVDAGHAHNALAFVDSLPCLIGDVVATKLRGALDMQDDHAAALKAAQDATAAAEAEAARVKAEADAEAAKLAAEAEEAARATDASHPADPPDPLTEPTELPTQRNAPADAATADATHTS